MSFMSLRNVGRKVQKESTNLGKNMGHPTDSSPLVSPPF
jgi:hypothetical protein